MRNHYHVSVNLPGRESANDESLHASRRKAVSFARARVQFWAIELGNVYIDDEKPYRVRGSARTGRWVADNDSLRVEVSTCDAADCTRGILHTLNGYTFQAPESAVDPDAVENDDWETVCVGPVDVTGTGHRLQIDGAPCVAFRGPDGRLYAVTAASVPAPAAPAPRARAPKMVRAAHGCDDCERSYGPRGGCRC